MPGATALSMTVAVLLSAPLLGACGEEDAVVPPAGSSTSSSRFPVTITRVGGVAGFHDSVSVRADGTVVATTKQGEVRCRLEASALDALRRGAAGIRDTDRPTGAPSGTADQLTVLLGAGGGEVGLDDPRVAPAARVVNQLLADLTGPASQRTTCT